MTRGPLATLAALVAEPLAALAAFLGGAAAASPPLRGALGPPSPIGVGLAAAVLYVPAYLLARRLPVPRPPNPVGYPDVDLSPSSYGRHRARRTVTWLAWLGLVAALSLPAFLLLFVLDVPAPRGLSYLPTLYAAGTVPTGYWLAGRLVAQYLPALRPGLYPEGFTRPLDEPDE